MDENVNSIKKYKNLILLLSFALVMAGAFLVLTTLANGQNSYFYTSLARAYSGDPVAQVMVGKSYILGDGTDKDIEKGLRWMEKSGNEAAIRWVAYGYLQGTHLPKDYIQAAKWIQKGTDKGWGWAYSYSAWIHHKGIGSFRDCKRAAELYEQAHAKMDIHAAAYLQTIYYTPECNMMNAEQAFKWAKIAAEQGNNLAYVYVGLGYVTGKGTEKNEAEAVKWLKKSAESNDPLGMYNLSRAYLVGTNGEKDLDLAAMWALRSYEAGAEAAPEMILYIASQYKYGEPPQPQKAIALLKMLLAKDEYSAKLYLQSMVRREMNMLFEEIKNKRLIESLYQ